MIQYIINLSLESNERFTYVQNYLLELTHWEELMKTPHFVAYGLIIPDSIHPLTKII